MSQVAESCRDCIHTMDEPWEGKWSIAHRCTADGECKGRTVGFDNYWSNVKPLWCPDLQGKLRAPAADQRYQEKEVHPGSPEAKPEDRKKEAARRWQEIRADIERSKP